MAITQNTYTGNGSTTNYSFTFPYLEATDIKVSVNGVATTAYTLANATTVSFNTAPANGASIRIYRETDDANLTATFYPGSAIRSNDLNENFTQSLYVAQETKNAVLGALLPNNSVQTSMIQDGAVTSAKIADGTIVDADVNASAAIAGTKISPNFGSQTVQTSGVVSHAGGSETAPTLTFTGDTNTGLYSPGADQVAISTGGTGRLFVDASGRVGVGASSLNYAFQVGSGAVGITSFTNSLDGASEVGLLLRGTNGSHNTSLLFTSSNTNYRTRQYFNVTDGSLRWDTSSDGTTFVEKLRITSDGKIGIGTTGPGAALEINAAASTSPAIFKINTSEVGRWDSSGRLLVGTSSAIAAIAGYVPSFQVQSATVTQASASITTTSNDAFSGGLIFGKQRSGAIVQNGDGLGQFRFAGYDGASYQQGGAISCEVDGTPGLNDMPGRLVFSTTADGASSPTERMRITNAGNVGIGTSAPDVKLKVEGASGTTTFATGTPAQNGVLFASNDSGTIYQLAYASNSTAYVAGTQSNIPFGFFTNNTERARIDSSGRLLVGTSTARDSGGNFGATTGKHIHLETTDIATFTGISNKTTGATALLTLGAAAGSGAGSVGVVAANQELGRVQFVGADGTTINSVAAQISAFVDATPGTNDMPGRIVLSTSLDGASTPTEQWRLNNAGTVIYNQPAPAAVNTTATLTVANLTAKIITSTTAAAVTMTLPLGTDMDTGFSGLYTNMAFEWYVINTGATNAVTVQANTGHSIVGSGTVAASNSGKFLSRRTAANTWVTYRLSS